MLNPWLAITFQAIRLGFETQNAMALRMLRLVSDVSKTAAGGMIADKAPPPAGAQKAAKKISARSGRRGTVTKVHKKRVRAKRPRLRHEMLSRPRGNPRHSRGSAQIVGQETAVGVATGWPTRDVGRRRQAACGSIPSAGPRDAARTCAIRGRIGVGRSRHCGHAHSDGERALQSVEALE
jgi:hypothetical protein